MKTVALLLDREEQERLLSSPDVVTAEASWIEKHRNKIITLSGAIAQVRVRVRVRVRLRV